MVPNQRKRPFFTLANTSSLASREGLFFTVIPQEAGPARVGFLILLSTETIAQRIYEWSFADAARELRENYPFVSRIRGENAERYLRFFSQLDPQHASAVSRALVKRMNRPVLLRQKKTELTDAEEKDVQAYLQFEEIRGPGGFRMLARLPQPRVVWTVELRKALKALVKERFLPQFGLPERLSPSEWVYEVDAGCICVRTWLDFGGRSSLSYHHMLFQRDHEPLRSHLSLLQWLGAASMTRWRALRADELMDAADTVCALSEHFVAEMRKLFT